MIYMELLLSTGLKLKFCLFISYTFKVVTISFYQWHAGMIHKLNYWLKLTAERLRLGKYLKKSTPHNYAMWWIIWIVAEIF